MHLSDINRKQHRFISFAISVVVVLWFICCISLYWNSPVYQLHVGQLYESRWLLSSLAVNVFFTYLFLQTPSMVLFSALFVANQYTIVYSIISFFVYTIDSINISIHSPEGRRNDIIQYLRLSVILIFLSLLGFLLSIYHIRRLILFAWEHQNIVPFVQKRLVQTCSTLHAALAFFSIYICLETISLKTTYIQSYVVQQLCCASLALIMAIVQSVLQKRSTRIINITIVVMNSCQLAQELAHAWSTYYVCIYMKSVAVHVDSNLLFDQVMISITLLIHGCRLILCALVTASLSGYAFEEEMLKRIIFQPDPDRLVSVAQAAQASRHDELCSLFLFLESVILALAYIALDISYFTLNITRRTLTASTGISLFYALFLALSFHIYRRDHITIALKVGCVFAIILLNCSLHTIYMFGEEFLIGTLNIKLFSNFPVGLLYGVDLIIAVYSTFIAIHCLRFNTRTILTHTVLQSQPSCISALLKMLNHLATINFLTLTLEFSLILIMKVGWKMNDPSINFGIHDWISVLSTFVLQKWVCLYERYQSCLLILILQLVVECITTLSFLSAQTNYIQLMISLARSNANINRLRQLLPVDHIIIILTDHSLQVLQWAISLCSLGFSLIVLNEIVVDKNETNGDLHPTVAVTNEPHMAPKNEPISINGLNGFNNNAFEDDTIQIVEIEPSGLTTNTENVA